ncbi:hypothetical protein [Providencia rustigianii]|uniref:hypothetical protein n=1 Tax=Providencia rustigianii TaxID=158850 RepID=UPI0035E8E33B
MKLSKSIIIASSLLVLAFQLLHIMVMVLDMVLGLIITTILKLNMNAHAVTMQMDDTLVAIKLLCNTLQRFKQLNPKKH